MDDLMPHSEHDDPTVQHDSEIPKTAQAKAC
jgi:hypothetical protein